MIGLAERISASGVWVFVAMVALLSVWETIAPSRELHLSTPRRWLAHLLLFLGASLPIRLLGIGPVILAVARTGSVGRFGLLARPEIPWLVRFLAAFLVLDLVRYLVHRMSHAVPWFWRFHLVHHSDRDFDFTDDLRFHPLDTALQIGASMAVIWVLAPPPLAVALSEVVAIAVGMFAHANLRLPEPLERLLRLMFITPGLHKIHHSMDAREYGRNLGVVFVWWDRLFGTYTGTPARGYEAMEFGVPEVDATESLRPSHLIAARRVK